MVQEVLERFVNAVATLVVVLILITVASLGLAAYMWNKSTTVEERTVPWNSASELEQMGFAFGANIIVLSGDDGLSGYARLRDSSRTWVSSGSDETRMVHGASIGEVHTRLADEMRPGVK